MKISRLKRALAGFLSAAMLVMCMPFSGITASAAETAETHQGSNCEEHSDEWIALTNKNLTKTYTSFTGYVYKWKDSGKYYLSEDITNVSEVLSIPSGVNVTLCLNGHTLSFIGSKYLSVVGTLDLCDCTATDTAPGGKIITPTGSNNSGAIYMAAGTFNMYGGQLVADSTHGIYNPDGNVNIYGGVIDGGNADRLSGVYFSGGTFNMYGGKICNSNNGIWSISDTAPNISGGVITENETAFIVNSVRPFNVSGTAKISGNTQNVYFMGDEALDISGGLKEGAEIYVNPSKECTIAKNAKPGDEKYFKCDDSSYAVYQEGTNINVAKTVSVTFDANGGFFEDNSVTKTIALPKRLTSAVPEPTREEFIFNGWYTAAADGTKIEEGTVLSNGQKLYAQWAPAVDTDINKPVTYLGDDVTLEPVAGDTTGTQYEFKNIPEITAAEADKGFKYVYSIKKSQYAQESAENDNNNYKKGRVMRGSTVGGTKDVTANAEGKYIITVDRLSEIQLVKVSPNYTNESSQYYMFAAKNFAAGKVIPPAVTAAKAIDTALDDLKPTNDTVKSDVQTIVDANKADTTATVTTFELTPATDETVGSLKVVVTVSDGQNTETVEKTYVIDKLPENKAEKAAEKIDTALDDLNPTNDTAKSDVQTIVDANKGDTTATVTTFELTPATEDKTGSLKVVVNVSDGENSKTVEKTYVIKKLPANKAEKAADDIDTALDDLKPTNNTAKSDVQTIVDANKGDTTATVTAFELTPATEDKTGSLKVVITVTDGNNTETVEKIYVIDKLPVSSDEGDIIVDTDNNVGGAGADGAEVKNAVEITSEEKALIDSGEDLHIILNVQNADSTVSDEDKALTESVLSDDMTAGMYLDITLFKKIGTLETAVTATNTPVTITFAMPESLINTDKNVAREFFIIRVHNGKADILNCTFAPATGKASFRTDKFSSYAIAYRDTAANVPVAPSVTVYYPIVTNANASADRNTAAAGETVNVRAAFGYDIIVTAANGQKIAKITENGSFVMPASKVYLTAVRNETYAFISAAWNNSYVYSYDSDMNRIRINSTNKRGVIVVDLGEEYADKSFTIYSGRKSTSVKVTDGKLDFKGRFKFEVPDGKNYTLVVED